MKKVLTIVMALILCLVCAASAEVDAELVQLAKDEGTLVTVGMPIDYANLGEVWDGYMADYGIEHFDTDLDSAQQIAKMVSEGKNATVDMGQVGFGFGNIAIEKGVTVPYKTSNWDEIPDWAKDPEGNWVLAYTGTIAFMTNLDLVDADKAPKSWQDILEGDYSVAIGDVTKMAQAQMCVLAAAYAFGGDENNIEPGLQFFQQIAKQGRLSKTDIKFANFEKGETEVAILWDFNALTYRDKIDVNKFDVCIPEGGSVAGGDASIINVNAPHINAAKLAREYLLSDAGQLAFANGYIRPIRHENLDIPEEVEAKLLANDQYDNVYTIKDCSVLQKIANDLPELWQDEVLIYVD